ncbi:MAG: hypothetical protein DRP56_07045 [Planctomycetota bacterium]|nr:MAG: hypothetical protein DRP56_07045 [Planctomycetota bacterium]
MAIDKTQLKAHLVNNSSDDLWDDLVGAWLCDNGAGTTITDYSGNDYHGAITKHASSAYTWTPDGIEYDDGAGNFVQAISSIPTSTIDAVTILALMKPVQADFSGTLVRAGVDYGVGGLTLYYNSAGTQVVLARGSNNVSAPVSDDTFVGLFGLYERGLSADGTLQIYKDKTLIDSDAGLTHSFSAGNSRIAVITALSGTSKIEFSCILIWDRKLSRFEIDKIVDNEYDEFDPIPTIARQMAERNNKIIGGKQTVY